MREASPRVLLIPRGFFPLGDGSLARRPTILALPPHFSPGLQLELSSSQIPIQSVLGFNLPPLPADNTKDVANTLTR